MASLLYPEKMGTRRVGSYGCLVLLGFLATGCSTSTKDRCEALCDWLHRCGGSATCTDAQIDECVDNYEKLDDDCQDAYDDFADCLDDNDECSDAGTECSSEASAVIKHCDGV